MSPFSNFQEAVYWLVPHPTTVNYEDKPLPAKTDVLVIGSGYTGTVAALQLRKAGMEVVLIDRTRVGTEASAKNGGMALSGLSASLTSILKKYGREKLIRFFNESLESINCVENLVKEGNIDCHFSRSGELNVAFKPGHFDSLKAEQELLSSYLNHEATIIPPEQLQEEIGSELYHGGLVEKDSAGVHPARYIAGLIRMADKAGVQIHECVTATNIERKSGKAKVETTLGSITADHIVLATNGYTTNLSPWQMRRVVPVESFMIATEELPAEIAKSLIPNNRMIFDTKRFLYYFRLSPDGKRMLFGGRPKFMNKSTLEKAKDVRRDMLQVYPQLEPFRIDYAWYGNVCFTPDYFPIIGQHEGISYAMGYCGHGVAMATYFGTKLADLILGKGLETVFAERIARPIPLYRGNPWFLPMIHRWFRFLDYIS